MRWLLFFYPWLELLSLIQLGIETNALVAVGWVLLMCALGMAILRRAGSASVARLREAQSGGLLQQQALAGDLSLVLSALLLIIPGLVSDLLAVVVLVGPLRRGLARLMGVRARTHYAADVGAERESAESPVTIEGDFERVDHE